MLLLHLLLRVLELLITMIYITIGTMTRAPNTKTDKITFVFSVERINRMFVINVGVAESLFSKVHSNAREYKCTI